MRGGGSTTAGQAGGLWQLFAGERVAIGGVLVAVVLGTLADLGIPVIGAYTIDTVLPDDDRGALVRVALALLGLLVVSALGQWWVARALSSVATRRLRNERISLATSLTRAGPQWHEQASQADILSRFQGDLAVLEDGMANVLPKLLRGLVLGAGSLVLMVWVDWRVTAVLLLGLGGLVLIPRFFGGRASEASRRRQEADADASGVLLDMLGAMPVVRAYALEGDWLTRYADRAEVLRRWGRVSSEVALVGAAASSTAGTLLSGIVLIFGAYLAIEGRMTAGALVAMLPLLNYLGSSINRLGSTLPLVARSSAAWGRLSELQSEADAAIQPAVQGTIDRVDATADVEFDDVVFSYDGVVRQLDGADLTIAARRRIAIVGESGSGKSTFLKALLGEVTPNSGTIRWGDAEQAEVSRQAWLAGVAYVPQTAMLFELTLRENVCLDRTGVTDDQLAEVAERACVHDVVEALPDRWDTPLGTRLSGGQRQRLAVARALLREPDLLVLDEATSALDPATAGRVLDEILASVDATIVAVTHRLDTAARFDEVVVMAAGRVVDRGTHDELLVRCAEYQRLSGHQAGFELDGAGRRGSVQPARLARIAPFDALDASTLAGLAERMAVETFQPGETIFRAGDVGDSLALIARGQVDIVDLDGRPIGAAQSGDVLGEIAALMQVPRTATVTARGLVTAFVLDQATLVRTVGADSDVLRELRALAAERLAADERR